MPEPGAVAVQEQPPRTTALAVPEDAKDAGKMVQVNADADALRSAIALESKPQKAEHRLSPELMQRLARPLIAVAIDQTRDYEDKVREQVNRQYTADVNKDVPKNFFGRALRHLKDTYKKNNDRLKLRQEAEDRILESQNIYYFNGDEAQGLAANNTTQTRFMTLQTDDVISKEAGENRTEFKNKEDPYAVGVRNLIKRYVNREFDKDGKVDEEAFNAEKDKFFADYRQEHGTDVVGEGKVQIDNLLRIAQEARDRVEALVEATVEHTESIKYVVDNLRIVAGQAHSSVYKGPEYSKTDQLIDKISDHRVGRWVSPELIAAAFTTGAVAARIAGAKFVSAATGGVGGLMAGGMAYARERKTLKDERAQHESETAVGAEFAADAKRRNKMEEFAYDTVKATDLIANLKQFALQRNELADNSDEAFNQALAEKLKTKEDIQAALNVLADVEARVKISNRSRGDNGKTLISFSSEFGKEQERFELGIARASVKVALEKRLANGGRELFDENELPPEKSFAVILQDYEQAHEKTLLAAAEKQDAAFNSYSRKRSLGVAALTGLVGATLAEGAHLGINAMSHSETVTSVVNAAKEQFTSTSYAGGASIEINGGYSVVSHDGMLSVKDAAGKIVPGLDVPVDAQGHIPPAIFDKINSQPGIHIENKTVMGPAGPSLALDQYAAQHPAEFKHLNVVYEDNNTANYDLNEQGGRLSMNPDGTVTIGQSMTADGSFNSTTSIDMTHGQNALDMSFKQPDGTMIHKTFAYGQPIPKPWADMLYQKSDGNWGFKGNGEIHWGKEQNGTFYTAASIGGDGQSMTIPGAPTETVHYKITVDVPQTVTEQNGYTPVVLPVPLVVRRPLEAPVEKEPSQEPAPPTPPQELIIEVPPAKKGGELELFKKDKPPTEQKLRAIEGKRTLESAERLALEVAPLAIERGTKELQQNTTMPELRDNPEARIELGAALAYHYGQLEQHDPELLRSLEKLLSENESLAQLALDSDVIVPWTFNAATDDAGKIYSILSDYAESYATSGSVARVLVNLTWTDADWENNQEQVQQVIDAVAQIRRDYPNVRLSSFETVIEKAKLDGADYGGHSLDDIALNRSFELIMAAAHKAVQNGRPADKDLLVLRRSRDSDAQNGSEARMLAAMEAHPEKDIFTGSVRVSLDRSYDRLYAKLPSRAFYGTVLETMRLVDRHSATVGFKQRMDSLNAGYRLSTIAAAGGGLMTTAGQARTNYDLLLIERIGAVRLPSQGLKAVNDPTVGQSTNSGPSLFVGSAAIEVDLGENAHNTPMEDLRKQPKQVMDQIERALSRVLNDYEASEPTLRTALAFLLPVQNNKLGYRINTDDSGHKTFTFTKSGSTWLLRQLRSRARLFQKSESHKEEYAKWRAQISV